MYIRKIKNYSFEDLKKECNEHAVQNLQIIERNGKKAEFMKLIETVYKNEIVSLTDINNMLILSKNELFEILEIRKKAEIIENIENGCLYGYIENNYTKLEKSELKDLILEMYYILIDRIEEEIIDTEIIDNLENHAGWNK